jgi:spore germination protein YaaH
VTRKITVLALGLVLAATGLAGGQIKQKGNFGIAGWLVFWNPKSLETFEAHADLIDRVYPEGYVLDAEGMPRSLENEYKVGPDRDEYFAHRRKMMAIAKAHDIQVFSMIVNYDNKKGEHRGDWVEKMLNDPALRKRHIAALVANAVKDGVAGIDIDYENMKAVDAKPLNQFMAELKAAAAPHGLLLAAALAPKSDADGTWDGNQAHDYKGLSASLDLLRPMTYDEHWGTSTAGPVSSPEYSEMVDRYAVAVAGADRVEIGLAGYGYDWKFKQGTTITYDDLQAMIKKGIPVKRDEETQELTGRYTDKDGSPREFWFCDAYSYRPKYAIIRKYKLAGLALWYFGCEDPRFWADVKAYKYMKGW